MSAYLDQRLTSSDLKRRNTVFVYKYSFTDRIGSPSSREVTWFLVRVLSLDTVLDLVSTRARYHWLNLLASAGKAQAVECNFSVPNVQIDQNSFVVSGFAIGTLF